VSWHRCDRCSFDYPVSRLVRQRGLILCIDKCVDNLLSFQRDKMIQDNLSQSAEQEMAVADILKQPVSDEMEQF
jgi:hypothetical protein